MNWRAALVACVICTAGASPGSAAAGPRIEARSASLLAVGLVDHDRMTIRVSRLADNAPVTNAAVAVKLRGAEQAATVQITVHDGAVSETLSATLQPGAEPAEEKNSTRQLLWWVLNFGVCIGFLWLISRRRKAAEES